jgi:hypothetical protein
MGVIGVVVVACLLIWLWTALCARRGSAFASAIGCACLAFSAWAGDDANPSKPPDVALDQLLKLPESFDVDPTVEKKGGANAEGWRKRFAEARGQLDTAQHALESAQNELASMAGDTANYQVAAPGAANPENSPVSFKLREEIRRQRAAVESSERALRDLEIEADLAEVPEAWRR